MKEISYSHFRRLCAALGVGLLALAGFLLLLGLHPRPALADPDDLFVEPGGAGNCSQASPCSLQTALGSATGGDTIYVAGGIYTGTGAAVVTVTQSIILYGGWDGSPTGPVVRDPDAHPTTLDGENGRRGVYISGDITPTLDGFMVIQGDASATPDAGRGGGIYSNGGSPVIVGNVISSNVGSTLSQTKGYGGGLYLASVPHTAVISDNTFLYNTAAISYYGYGGGIYCDAAALIEHNRLEQNRASVGWTGYGGGMELATASDAATVRANTIISNVASEASSPRFGWGGGLRLHYSSATVAENIIVGNKSGPSGNGGGVLLWYANGSRLVGNLIQDNESRSNGGGIYVGYAFDGGLEIVGNRVLRNTTGSSGGGLYILGSRPVTVANNILASNRAHLGAGVHVRSGSGHSPRVILAHNTLAGNQEASAIYGKYSVTMSLINNIVLSHTVGITVSDPLSANLTVDHNLFWGNDGDGIRGANPVDGDPLLVDPAGWDYHIQAGSPAIDAGAAVPWLTTDMDGDLRPIGLGYDIGADEFYYCTALTGVDITGPVTGTASTACVFTATVAPPTANLPITYTWSPQPAAGQSSAVATYTWMTTGTKAITVTAENCGGAVSSDPYTITIAAPPWRYVYLPLVVKDHP
jgi:hypothetical protein